MKMYDIKEMVKDNKQVYFIRYQNKELWYVTECGFEFPVPERECGVAAFYSKDKALLYMRYIRNHISFLKEAALDQNH